PSLITMPLASSFLPMLPVNQPLIPSRATSAGPVVPTSSMGSFSANSPMGIQTFQAQYIMYAPFGPAPPQQRLHIRLRHTIRQDPVRLVVRVLG
ncbi:MAG TPA: hypothetical protein VE860_27745, partial [Chthoniobacterales bacterium]|nr:hypothetical protein [Chthoniobacterales bacterium]